MCKHLFSGINSLITNYLWALTLQYYRITHNCVNYKQLLSLIYGEVGDGFSVRMNCRILTMGQRRLLACTVCRQCACALSTSDGNLGEGFHSVYDAAMV